MIPHIRNILFDTESYFLTEVIIGSYILAYFIGSIAKIPRIKILERGENGWTIWIVLVLLAFTVPVIFKKFLEFQFTMVGFREFYIQSRFEGYGFFFTAVSYLLLFCILYLVHKKRFKLSLLLLPLLLLFGQKTILLNLILGLLFILEYEFLVSKKFLVIYLTIGVAILIGFHYSLSFGITGSPVVAAIGYFDYYDNLVYLTRSLYADERLSLFNGELFITDFYRFVPRFIWPDKPDVYGAVLIHQELYPKLLQEGYTPSFYETIAAPLADFGWVGVICFGFARGYISRLIYNSYVISKKNYILLYLFLFSNNQFALVLSIFLIGLNKVKWPRLILK